MSTAAGINRGTSRGGISWIPHPFPRRRPRGRSPRRGVGTGRRDAADPPVVNWAQSDFDNDYGTLLVSATAADGVTALKAHILTFDTHEEVATTETFTLRSGTPTDGVWASAPILLDNLGQYVVDVEATGAGGQHVRQDGVGSLYYAEVTFFENVSLDRTKTTYDKRTVDPARHAEGPPAGIGRRDADRRRERHRARLAGLRRRDHEGRRYVRRHDRHPHAAEDVWVGTGQVATVLLSPSARAAARDRTATAGPGSPRRSTRPNWIGVTASPSPARSAGRSTAHTCHGPGRGLHQRLLYDEQSSCTFIEAVVTDADGRLSYTYTPYGTGYLGVTYLQRTANGAVDPYVGTDFKESRKFIVRQPSEFPTSTAARTRRA